MYTTVQNFHKWPQNEHPKFSCFQMTTHTAQLIDLERQCDVICVFVTKRTATAQQKIQLIQTELLDAIIN